MEFPRQSGILLHPTSLPGPYGIGELGPEAYKFADFLHATGQHLWQVLPIGPTGYADSPYQCLSTFAGNTLLISFDLLAQDGLLSRSRLERFPKFDNGPVDFGPVIIERTKVLHSVCRMFKSRASEAQKEAFAAFCRENAFWLDDFALFFALKNAHELRPWTTWESELAGRDPHALAAARRKFKTAMKHVKLLQFFFFDHWKRLMDYCHARKISVVGDIPIFVAHDSADVWANPELFYLDQRGFPTVVAGVPPDYFSATGQLWGNPLYRWDIHKKTDYAWWVARMRQVFKMVDIVRIDHFRGFAGYWEIPGNEKTAINGKWVPGPAADFFEALNRQLGRLPIIAEDLGVITPDVDALREHFTLPGMRVLQFAFGNDAKAADYRPDSYPTNCVVYSGTHDNDTTVGWFNSEPGKDSTRTHEQIEAERKSILQYLKSDGREINWDLIALAWRSNANTAIVPMQDVLGLGSEARMNVPGRAGGNWRWRFTWDLLKPEMKDRLAGLTKDAKRA